MKNLVVFGTSFFDVIKLVDAINRHEPSIRVMGFLDDRKEFEGTRVHGVPVLGGRAVIPTLMQSGGVAFFNNVNRSLAGRKEIAALYHDHQCEVASLIHPQADCTYVAYGKGCLLPEGTVLGGRVTIGDYLTCRLGTLISHDVTIGDYVFLAAGARLCGHSVVENDCFIGAGATVLDGVRIGTGSIVGAGATVTKDVEPGMVVAGAPAKPVKSATADPLNVVFGRGKDGG